MSRYLLVLTTILFSGTPLTAVAVGLSIVALDDEEMKMPVSIWHAATAKNAIAVSYQQL